MLSAFATAAGFSAATLGLFFKTFFAGILTLWAAWVAYKQFILFTEDKLKIGSYGKNLIFLVMIWTFLMLTVVV